MTIRLFVAAIMLGSIPTVAAAQASGGPPIAYVKRVSNGDEIYLVNDNGSGLIRLYKAPSKIVVTMLDLRPSGGEIAFTENHRSLKILAFDEFGRPSPGNPREILRVSSPCSVESPDYHPTNGTLLFVEGCGRDRSVRTVGSGGNSADEAALFSTAVFRARWSRLGDWIYYIGLRPNAASSDPTYLYRRSSSAGSDGADELGILNTWNTFDVARQGERLFWDAGNGTFQLLDLATGTGTGDATQLECPRGMRMAFSPGDTSFVYTTSTTKGGHYVMVGGSNCGQPNALTGKGSWSLLDWRSP